MKYIFNLAGILFLLSSCSLFQNKEVKVLSAKVDSLTRIVDTLNKQNKILDEEFTWIENELVKINSVKQSQIPDIARKAVVPGSQAPAVITKETNDWQCQALTSSGKRCSRPAIEGSKYCWQHKKTYEPNSPVKEPDPKPGVSSTPEKK